MCVSKFHLSRKKKLGLGAIGVRGCLLNWGSTKQRFYCTWRIIQGKCGHLLQIIESAKQNIVCMERQTSAKRIIVCKLDFLTLFFFYFTASQSLAKLWISLYGYEKSAFLVI